MIQHICDKCKKQKECRTTIFDIQLCESCMKVWNEQLKQISESYQKHLKELADSFIHPKVVIEIVDEEILS